MRLKAEPWVRHTTEPGFMFTPRKGWFGGVHFSWSAAANDYVMDRISHRTEALSPGALRDELAAIKNRYGTPATKTATAMTWSQAGTTLTVTVSTAAATKLSSLSMVLRLDAP